MLPLSPLLLFVVFTDDISAIRPTQTSSYA